MKPIRLLLPLWALALLPSCASPRYVHGPTALNIPYLQQKHNAKIGAFCSGNGSGTVMTTKDNCGNPSESLGAVRDAIFEKNQLFAAAVANDCYTKDAEFMAPGAPSVQGRANIEQAMAGFINQGFTKYTVLSTVVYADAGIVGVQEAYTLSKADGSDGDRGKAIQLWKQEDGSWKIFRDCFNSDLTP